VGYDAGYFRGLFGVSEDGVLAYSPVGATEETQLAWVDRSGKKLADVSRPGQYGELALSPDSRRVAFSLFDSDSGATDIWVEDLARGARTRLTFGPASERNPVWSPDGERIVFNTNAKYGDLYVKPAAGGTEELLLHSEDKSPTDWSRDGKLLFFQTNDSKSKTHWDIAVLDMTKKSDPVIYLRTEFNEQSGKLSPDGRWMAYISNESGRDEVYVAPYPLTGGKWQLSQGGCIGHAWGREGKEVLLIVPRDRMKSVSITPRGAGLEVGSPTLLFEAPDAVGGATPWNAERFLIAFRPKMNQGYSVLLATGWAESLRLTR